MNPINVTKKTNEAIESVPKEDIFDFYLNIINKNVNEALTGIDNGHLRTAIRNTFTFDKSQASYKLISQNDVRVAFSKKMTYNDVVKNSNPTDVKDVNTGKYDMKKYSYESKGEKVQHNIYSVLTFDVVELNGKIYTKNIISYVDFMTDATGESPVSDFDFDLNKNIKVNIEYSKTNVSQIIDAFVEEYEGALVENRLVTENKSKGLKKDKYKALEKGWCKVDESSYTKLTKFNKKSK